MAERTTSQAGVSSSSSTWGGQTPPGDGDTAVVNHALTFDANTTVGTGSGFAITQNAQITVGNGITLTVKGGIIANNSKFAMGPGSIVEFDDDAAMEWRLGTDHVQNAYIEVRGTSGSKAQIRTKSGAAGRVYISSGGFIAGGRIDAEHCIFTRVGSASNHNTFWPNDDLSWDMRFQNCLFDACADFEAYSGSLIMGNATLDVYLCCWKNSVGTYCIDAAAYQNKGASAVRKFQDVFFDKRIRIPGIIDFTFLDVYLMDGIEAGAGPWVQFERVFYRMSNVGPDIPQGGMKDVFVLKDTASSNPHYFSESSDDIGSAFTMERVIFELTSSDTAGDLWLAGAPPNARTTTFLRCHVLPNRGGTSAGTFPNAGTSGNTNPKLQVDHCTVHTGSIGGATTAETSNGFAGQWPYVKNSIWWTVSGEGCVMREEVATTTNTIVEADYNCHWNKAGAAGFSTPYNVTAAAFQATPGTHDVVQAPAFVNDAADIASWATSLGLSGATEADRTASVLAEFQKRNDPDASYNTAVNLPALLSYIDTNFAPTNSALATSAKDGTQMGAVAVTGGGGGGGVAKKALHLRKLMAA